MLLRPPENAACQQRPHVCRASQFTRGVPMKDVLGVPRCVKEGRHESSPVYGWGSLARGSRSLAAALVFYSRCKPISYKQHRFLLSHPWRSRVLKLRAAFLVKAPGENPSPRLSQLPKVPMLHGSLPLSGVTLTSASVLSL